MSRMMSLNWGASASQPSCDKNTKKRTLLNPTSPAVTKRQKSGPFIIDSDEDSDGDRGNDDGTVENNGFNTLITPTGSIKNRLQSSFAKDHGMIAPGAILQHQASNGPERMTFGSKQVTASQPGKERNNDRFKMMMARKQGGTVARGSEQRPLQPGLRSRPMNTTHANNLWQEKPLSFTADDDSLQLDGPQRGTSYLGPRGVRQQRDTPRCSSSVHASADARSNLSSGPVGTSLFEVENPFQTRIGRPQKPANEEYPQLAMAQARTWQPPTSRAPNSSVSRKTEAPRWPTPPNSCSLRNILDVTKAEDNGAAQKQNSGGSEWRRAQAQRASMVSARKVPKPEVGARYGHTLTAKKMGAAQKAPVDTKSTRGFRDDQIPVARDSNSPGLPAEGKSSRAAFPPNTIAPVKRKSTPQSVQPARQKTVPRLVSQGSPKIASGSGELSAPPNPTKQTVNSSPLEEIPGRPERMSIVSSPADTLFSEVEGTTRETTIKPQSPSHLVPITQPRSSVGILSDIIARDIAFQNEATNTTEPPDTSYKVPISHEFEVCVPRFLSYESAVRTNVPVAVMVRPKQGLSGPFLRGNNNDKPLVTIPGDIGIETGQNTSTDDALEGSQVVVEVDDAQTHAALATKVCLETAGRIGEISDASGLAKTEPLVPGRAKEVPISVPSNAITSRQQPSTPPEPTVLPKPIDSDCGTHHSSRPSSSIASQRVLEPVNPPEETQLEPVAITMPTRSTTEPSSPQPCFTVPAVVDAATSTIDMENLSVTSPTPRLASPVAIVLPSPNISPDAEPYYEYTIHQSLTSLSSGNTVTDVSAQPLMCIDVAISHAENSLKNTKQQFGLLGLLCRSTRSQVDEDGLAVHEAIFESNDKDPSKAAKLTLWITRAEVGVHANHTPSAHSSSPSISRTVYLLRLWELVEVAKEESDSESNNDDESEDEQDGHDAEHQQHKQTRTHCPLPPICTEIHTSLDAANRAAKRVQIYLSHDRDPKTPLDKQWQHQKLQELNCKVEDLRKEVEDGETEEVDESPSLFEFEQGRRKGCWRSWFDGVGPGAASYELLVCKVGLSGPRNL